MISAPSYAIRGLSNTVPSVSFSVLAGFRSSKTWVFMEVSDLHLNGVGSDQHFLSSAGAATGIIFVETKKKKKKKNRDKHVFATTKHVFCLDKSMFVETNIFLSRQNFCRDNYLARPTQFCRDKLTFVATNTCLS